MDLDLDDEIKSISLSAMNVEQLLLEALELIKERAVLHDRYREVCMQISTAGNIDKSFSIQEELRCW